MAATPTPKPKNIEGVPLEKLREIAKRYRTVNAKICRRNDRGTLQTIYGKVEIDIDTFPFIEDWLKDKAGGGRYELELFNPDDAFDQLVPRFVVFVEGRPHPVKDMSGPSGVGPGGAAPPTYRTTPASFAAGADMAAPPGYPDRPAPGATMASDQMAMQVIQDLKVQLEQEKAQAKADREQLEDKVKKLDTALMSERMRAQDARYEAKVEALEAKLLSRLEQPAAPPPKQTGLPELIAALGPIAPVLAALVNSNKESSLESLRMQQSNQQAFLNMVMGQANKPDQMIETIKGLAPMVLPFIQQLIQQRGPEAQTAMFEAMANNQLNQASMVAQLMEMIFQSNASEEQSAWLPVIRTMLAGGMEAMEAWMSQKGAIPGQQLPPPGPIGYQPGQEVPATVRHAEQAGGFATVDVDGDTPEEAAGGSRVIDINPASVSPKLKLIMSLMPSEFQTVEWKRILTIIHQEPPPPAAQVAELVFDHLDHLQRFDLLPAQLEDFFDNPRERLQAMLERLPVWRSNGKYAIALIDATLEILAEQEEDDEEDDDADEDDRNEEESTEEVKTESFGNAEGSEQEERVPAEAVAQTA